MGASSIDIMQSQDITNLEDDVKQLNDKLNALILEFNKCSDDTETNAAKITTLITDVNDHKTKIDTLITDVGKIGTLVTDVTSLKNKITSGYTASQTTGGGSNSDAILERLSNLDQDFKELSEHYQYHVTNVYDHGTYGHDSGGRSGNRGGGGGIGVPTDRYIDITAASTASTGAAASSGTASGTSSGT